MSVHNVSSHTSCLITEHAPARTPPTVTSRVRFVQAGCSDWEGESESGLELSQIWCENFEETLKFSGIACVGRNWRSWAGEEQDADLFQLLLTKAVPQNT